MKPRILVATIALALLGLGGAARADEFLKPGDSMTLELPIENEDPRGGLARNILLTPTFEEVNPPELAQFLSFEQARSFLGPVDIEVGEQNSTTFKVKVVVAANADKDGTFKVRLRFSEGSTNKLLMPEPETLDTSVSFAIPSPDFSTRTA